MKKFYIIVFTLMALLAMPFGCKDISSSENLFPLTPANVDANAGTWKTILLISANQISIPDPAVTTQQATYLTELEAIKDAQSKLTADQKRTIEYWSVGGVLRWNQLFRKLVAQFNLPPVPNVDGSYPFPDSENPFSNPQFPFANPPYAARAYSYVHVAMYDALLAAWYYKNLYKSSRPDSPYEVDNAIQSLMPKVDLPPYPSEEATMSGAVSEMLKVLFPTAVEEITKLAADQRNSVKWAGKATDTDIAAGLALGKAVATLITANSTGTFTLSGASGAKTINLSLTLASRGRFRTDNLGAAVGSAASWKALADAAIAKGETPWISLEVPPRPPMLPGFGTVKVWGDPGGATPKADNITPVLIIASERPVAPPSTTSEEMKRQLAEVKSYAKNVTRSQISIVHKWADGAGTYTPPGHWNDIAEEYIRDAKFSEVRAARAFALLNMAFHNAAVACWETKYFYFNPRPGQLDGSIKTTTGVPNFPAYTSGHSTISAAAAAVLSYLFPQNTHYFNDQAKEASNSRLYGAIHFRADIEMGFSHGSKIGSYTVNFAQTDGAN